MKVKVDFKVFHVPGFKDGMEIKDKEGTIDSNITDYQGISLSPNYPWKVRIDYEAKGKPKKFFVHLVCFLLLLSCILLDTFSLCMPACSCCHHIVQDHVISCPHVLRMRMRWRRFSKQLAIFG